MKVYSTSEVRNVGIVGHGDSGKTSLVSAMLYTAGVTTRLTRVDEGNTVTDYDEEEIARKVSVSSALANVAWNNVKINLIDTPGYNIFINDSKAAMIAADTALVVVDSLHGVEVQTEKGWSFAQEYGIPRIVLINRMVKERADFAAAVKSVQDVLSPKAIPVQLPIGKERDFKGVVDLVEMKAYIYEFDGNGRAKVEDIPADMAADAESARETLMEAVAECDDELLNEYLENLTLPPEKLAAGLRKGITEQEIFPVLCSSGLHNLGTDAILNFIEAYTPDPSFRGEIEGSDGKGGTIKRKISDSEPLSLYVFKTAADPFAGRVTYFKVVSGVLKNDDTIENYTRGGNERFSRISTVQGKDLGTVAAFHAGDIGAVAKLRDTLTGDSLGQKGHDIHFPKANLPLPAISFAIQPKTRQDEDRLSQAIHKVLEEDPTLNFYRDEQTQEFLLAGNGQQHLEVIVSRLEKRYHVAVELKAPKIPYRETIRGHADAHGRHKKQTGGHGQFGDCKIKMEPLERGKNFEFVNEIFGGAIPKTYIPAVEKGIIEAAHHGFVAGYPVVDFKVVLYDGSYHDVDSSELAFKLAGRKAFRKAMEQAKPALLEPVMNVEVVAPIDFAGDLMGDINSRRGRIQGMDTKGQNQTIKAQVPMAEMLTYANDLTSMTQGRASFSMEFAHYDFVPQQQADKIIAAAGGRPSDEDDEG